MDRPYHGGFNGFGLKEATAVEVYVECETEIVYRLIDMAKIGATYKPSNDYLVCVTVKVEKLFNVQEDGKEQANTL